MDGQKEYLVGVKRQLEARIGCLTWDEMARQASVEPRALKTYRLPEGSANYRSMPPVVRQAFENLLNQPVRDPSIDLDSLVPALAWLVMSQAHVAVIERQIISGLDRYRGAENGLTVEERRVMAMLSRQALMNGLPDVGGEIHVLLEACTRPLGQWLPVPAVLETGYGDTVLIDPDSLMPTPEAQDLAAGFWSVSAHIEESLFAKFAEALDKYSPDAAADYYTLARKFIVTHPVATNDELFAIARQLPSVLGMALQQEFYEPVPEAFATRGIIQRCGHCNSLLKNVGGAQQCQATACRLTNPTLLGLEQSPADCRRVTRGIRQYWVEPGIDEIRLYRALADAGLAVSLYPYRDRVDVAVGDEIGIDLKTYASPEILGARFRKGLGGLAHYPQKLIVIPDWLVRRVPAYLDRLTSALGDSASRVRCRSLSQAIADIVPRRQGRVRS